jgi:hypothetical protein
MVEHGLVDRACHAAGGPAQPEVTQMSEVALISKTTIWMSFSLKSTSAFTAVNPSARRPSASPSEIRKRQFAGS